MRSLNEELNSIPCSCKTEGPIFLLAVSRVCSQFLETARILHHGGFSICKDSGRKFLSCQILFMFQFSLTSSIFDIQTYILRAYMIRSGSPLSSGQPIWDLKYNYKIPFAYIPQEWYFEIFTYQHSRRDYTKVRVVRVYHSSLDRVGKVFLN